MFYYLKKKERERERKTKTEKRKGTNRKLRDGNRDIKLPTVIDKNLGKQEEYESPFIVGIVKDRIDSRALVGTIDDVLIVSRSKAKGRCAFAPCLSWGWTNENKSGGRNE